MLRVLLASAVLVLSGGWLLASPAGAHAVLTGSSPGDGERLGEAPESVTIRFNEPVGTELGGLTVLDQTGERVDRGDVLRPSSDSVQVELDDGVDVGTYLASYRVVSADGHVISGAVVFAVGDDLDRDAVAGLAISDDPLVVGVGRLAQTLAFLGVLVAAGLTFFGRFLHDGATDRGGYAPFIRVACVVAAVGAVGVVVARAAEGTGGGLDAIASDGIAGAVLRTGGLGWSVAVLALGLAAIYVASALRSSTVADGLGFYGSLLAVGSFALTGHTADAPQPLLAALADVTHVAVAALWVGGLLGMWLLLRWRRNGSPGQLADTTGVALRLSTAAAVSVAVLFASGLALSTGTLSGPGDLIDTAYGRTLAVKVLVVLAVLAVAAYNRWALVPHILRQLPEFADEADDDDASSASDGEPPVATAARPGDEPTAALDEGGSVLTMVRDDPGPWQQLRGTLRLELIGVVAVVAITAVLVTTPPARISELGADPFNDTVTVTEGVDLNLFLTPGEVGTNTLHITYLGPGNATTDRVGSVSVTVALPAADVAPITVPANGLGPGHWIASTDAMAVAGLWQVEVTARVDGFNQEVSSFEVPIGEP
ncbi:MAG: copper resistance protein CopC/CopD [Acidimicrobiia bacterium]|nr:copper resistance protein CopC/CopD [Acidimicrobiia bacterium]